MARWILFGHQGHFDRNPETRKTNEIKGGAHSSVGQSTGLIKRKDDLLRAL